MSGYEIVTKAATRIAGLLEFDEVDDSVDCRAGKVVVGGGATASTFSGSSPTGTADLLGSFPKADGSGWWVTLGKTDGSPFTLPEGIDYQIYAVCVTAN